jgi:hypothetical protein
VKEFLYVGHYYDENGKYILKVGTTNDLQRRRYEHNVNYRKAKRHRMPKENSFEYDWYIQLSKYNTLRFEDRTREMWKELAFGEFLNNDRFVCEIKPVEVEVKIRKVYKISL